MNQVIQLTGKWIENAVRRCLNKPQGELTVADMAQIKYLKIGEGFDNTFVIELSTSCPPKPFKAMLSGDEWEAACLLSKDISAFIEMYKQSNDMELSVFDFEHEDVRYTEDEIALCVQFDDSIIKEGYYEACEDQDEDGWDGWYEQTVVSFQEDIQYFTHVEVLRLQGGNFKNFKILENLTKLRVAEFVETSFESTEGIEVLEKLDQLCCWLD